MAASGQLPGFNVIFKSPLERLSCHAYVLGGSPNLGPKISVSKWLCCTRFPFTIALMYRVNVFQHVGCFR